MFSYFNSCDFVRNPKALDYAENTINYITKSDKCFAGLASMLRNEDKYLLGRCYTGGKIFHDT